MRLFILSAAFVLGAATAPAHASMTGAPKAPQALNSITIEAQAAPQTRAYRRCMRAKYGPRYFAGVRRAHRWHMAQACMAGEFNEQLAAVLERVEALEARRS